MKNLILTSVIFIITSTPAISAPMHGLSLYGPEGLKYKPGQVFDYANPKAPKGGQLVLSDFGAFTKLNPASLKGVTAPGIGGMVFQTAMDGSIDENEAFSQYGNMVETVDLADDRMTMIYHIYKNAKFSDGKPVTADDFVFSFELLKHPEYHPVFKEYFKDIKKVEKLDTHTVKYTFGIYNQELPLITGQMIIFPKHIYGQPGKNFGSDFDNIAIGSGPYVVDKYEYGKYITLKRNPNWWAKDLAINQGHYNYDTITWKIYLDPTTQREAFKGGEFDAEMVNSSKDWALDFQGDYVKKGYYLREELPHHRVAGMQGYVMNMRNEILASRKVRAALAMAFDFEWSNKNLFYNQYTRSECFFDNNPEMKPKGIPEGEVKDILLRLQEKYPNQIPKTAMTKPVGTPGQGIPFEKNVVSAKELLESEGWKVGDDGIRVKNGKRLHLTLLIDNPGFIRISEPYKNNLKKIGADLEIKTVQVAEYEELLRNFNFDMIVGSYPQSRSPGNEQRSLWSSEASKTPGSRNYSGLQNPAVDELIEKIVQAKTRKELVNYIQAMDRILTHQFIVVPHWYIAYDRLVSWNKFSRSKITSTQAPAMSNVLEWWWWDEDKAKKLATAQSAGTPVK